MEFVACCYQIFSILEVLLFRKFIKISQTGNFMSMTENQSVKEALELKRTKLIKAIKELKELTKPEAPDSAIGRVSRMDAINNRSINEATLRKKQLQLNKIEEALKEVNHPSFGKCIRCGKTIQVARILIMPESKVCVNCAG